MKAYSPYLLYQVARFGALTIPQLLKVCEGKCKRSSLYRSLRKLINEDFIYPILNPATSTRAYYATAEGRRYAFGNDQLLTAGVKPAELDHTVLCAEILMSLSTYENVTGVATHFELGSDEFKRFCHGRIPDGIIQLTQGTESYELAVELESSNRSASRVADVLNHYWETFRKGYECSGLLVVAMTPAIAAMYSKAVAQMPSEFQSRVRILEGLGLQGLNHEAFGRSNQSISRCLDLSRTSCLGTIQYSPTKTDIYLSQFFSKPRKDEDTYEVV